MARSISEFREQSDTIRTLLSPLAAVPLNISPVRWPLLWPVSIDLTQALTKRLEKMYINDWESGTQLVGMLKHQFIYYSL